MPGSSVDECWIAYFLPAHLLALHGDGTRVVGSSARGSRAAAARGGPWRPLVVVVAVVAVAVVVVVAVGLKELRSGFEGGAFFWQ